MGRRKTPLPFPLSGECIRHYRTKRKYSQQELADMVGVTRHHISLIETGREMASISLLFNFAKVLGTPIDKLLQSNNPAEESLRSIMHEHIDHLDGDQLFFVYQLFRASLTVLTKVQIIPSNDKEK